MIDPTVRKAARLLAYGGAGLALLTGCSSGSSGNATTSATRTQGGPSSSGVPIRASVNATPSGASTSSPAPGECTEASILAALPPQSTMDKYECAIASPNMWAAARVKPGPRLFFLQTNGGVWKVSTADQLCRTPKANLPPEILAFCPKG